jgi:Kef-type K+ transport system membrane component KefB
VKHARNVAILMLIALAIVAVPGGGDAAALVGAILSLLIFSLLAYFAGRFYRDHQVDIYGVGDLDRAILYTAIALVVIVLVGWGELFGTSAGTIVAIALLALSAGGLTRVYRNWQRY